MNGTKAYYLVLWIKTKKLGGGANISMLVLGTVHIIQILTSPQPRSITTSKSVVLTSVRI